MSEPQVLHEDKDFLVIVKPAGLLMHPFRVGTDSGKVVVTEPTLTDWLKTHYPETKTVGDNPEMRPGLVHRLDRETSGLVLVARNQKTFEYLKSLFQSGKIRKTYFALVYGIPKEAVGRIEKSISLKPGTTKRTVHGGKMTKEAVTLYEVAQTFNRGGQVFALLRVQPLTGRTHQIRVHLASIGHPILGDHLYGGKHKKEEAELGITRLMLHATELSFPKTDQKTVTVESPLSADFDDFLRSLSSDSG